MFAWKAFTISAIYIAKKSFSIPTSRSFLATILSN